MKNSHPSCQGFRDPLHQVKRLGSRQPKKSRFSGSIGINLEEGEEFRGVLNFIDQDGRRKPLEKKRGSLRASSRRLGSSRERYSSSPWLNFF